MLRRLVLTYLAPADRCNQRCPACIIDRLGEPVSEFELRPQDFAQIATELIEDGVPIRGINFQGYEVTLPRSWPYLESVFEVARCHNVRRTFITNGMLLAKHTESIIDLDPQRISVSLDGADAVTNDRLRGLSGAFAATLYNLERFLADAPQFAERLSIVSTLYDDENVESLRAMPSLVRRLGIPRWAVTLESDFKDGQQTAVHPAETIVRWASELAASAQEDGIAFQFNDEFGILGGATKSHPPLRQQRLFDPESIVRVDPAGFMRVGRELLTTWQADEKRRWQPGKRRAAEVIGYRQRLS